MSLNLPQQQISPSYAPKIGVMPTPPPDTEETARLCPHPFTFWKGPYPICGLPAVGGCATTDKTFYFCEKGHHWVVTQDKYRQITTM